MLGDIGTVFLADMFKFLFLRLVCGGMELVGDEAEVTTGIVFVLEEGNCIMGEVTNFAYVTLVGGGGGLGGNFMSIRFIGAAAAASVVNTAVCVVVLVK